MLINAIKWLVVTALLFIAPSAIGHTVGQASNNSKPPLDYSKPITVDGYAIFCPLSNNDFVALAKLYTAMFPRNQERMLGCQEVSNGLRVYNVHKIKTFVGIDFVEVSIAPQWPPAWITTSYSLKNDDLQ